MLWTRLWLTWKTLGLKLSALKVMKNSKLWMIWMSQDPLSSRLKMLWTAKGCGWYEWFFIMSSWMCRPSILSLDIDIYPLGVTCTHRSHMAPLGPFLGLVGVRASCGLVCGPLWCVCSSFWRVIVAIFLVVHITLQEGSGVIPMF